MDIPGGNGIENGQLQKEKRQMEQIHVTQQEQSALIDFKQIDKKLYENRDAKRTKEVIKLQNTEIEQKKPAEQDRVTLLRNCSQLLVRDKKWYNVFNSESPEMTYVKDSLNYLNNLLNGEVPMLKQNGNVIPHATALENMFNQAYITVLDACDKYMKSHANKAKHSTGIRRLAKVTRIHDLVQQEKADFEMAISNLRSGVVPEELNHPIDLLRNVRIEEAVISDTQEEGNCTNVNRVLLKIAEQQAKAETKEATNTDTKAEEKEATKEETKEETKTEEKEATKEETKEETKTEVKEGAKVELKSGNSYQVMMVEKLRKIRRGRIYVKKDEKLLNQDPLGYLKRRIDQLKRSRDARNFGKYTEEQYAEVLKQQKDEIKELRKQIKEHPETEKQAMDRINEIRYEQEEMRLQGRMDEEDYDQALNLLETMKKKLESLSGDALAQQCSRYVNFLGHDFDSLFMSLKYYNTIVDRVKGNRTELEQAIQVFKDKMKYNDNKSTQAMLATLEQGLKGNVELKKKTQLEVLKERLSDKDDNFGLDLEKDKDILALLEKMYSTQDRQQTDEFSNRRIERLFTRSLGKEAELFGQQCERSGLSDTQALATNNVATSSLACSTNMMDVSTICWKSKLTYQEYGKKVGDLTTAVCTLSEEAEGEEMLSIVEQAEELRKERKLNHSILHYSPNAVRQMVRLQMFDTMCLQTDRHWRNFKCKVTKSEDPLSWTIESLKSYDHDQSFGPKTLDQFYKDAGGVDAESLKSRKLGFLPPLNMTVKKGSKLYYYLKKKLIGGTGAQMLKNITEPKMVGPFAESDSGSGMQNDALFFYPQAWMKLVMEDMGSMEEGADTAVNIQGLSKDLLQCIKEKNPGQEKEAEELMRLLKKMTQSLIKLQVIQAGIVDVNTGDPGYMTMKERVAKEGVGEVSSVEHMSVTEVLRDLISLNNLYQKLKLDNIEESIEQKYHEKGASFLDFMEVQPGMFHYMIQGFMYQLKLRYANSEAEKALEEEGADNSLDELKAQIAKEGKYGTPDSEEFKAELEKRGRELGLIGDSIEVPTMLHMDRVAYDSICERLTNWEETELQLRNLGWKEDKRLALKKRMEEIRDQKEKAERFLNMCAENQGWEKDDIRRKFLLDQEDYEKLESITDIVADPSISYFSNEDPSFLAGEEDYAGMMTRADMAQAIRNANDMRSTERQHLKKINEYEDKYIPMVSGKIHSSEQSKVLPVNEAEMRKEAS